MTTRKDVPNSRSPLQHLEFLTSLLGQDAPISDWMAPALARIADALGATTAALCAEGLPAVVAEACDATLSVSQREWVRSYGGRADVASGTAVLLVDGKRAGGSDNGFTATGWRSALIALFSVGETGRAALVVGYGGNHLFSDGDVVFSRAVTNVLATALDRVASQQAAEIRRAKREWEVTVDSLPQVVCLLDREGCVLRVNRAVERWGIGDIRGLRGRDGSCIFETCCPKTRCASRETYRQFWVGTADPGELTWEAECPALARTVRMTLRRLHAAGHNDPYALSYAVMVIEDVSEQRKAEATLHEYNRCLESAVEERTERLAEANARLEQEVARHRKDKSALARSERELRALSARLMEVQEAERKRFAAELHDGIGQSLTAIKFALESHAGGPGQAPVSELVLGKVREALDETRRIAMDLRPAMLDDLGLIPTLEWFCREFQRVYGSLRVESAFCVDERVIAPGLRVPIFRITQEAMNNAAKHANARLIQVSLRERAGRLQLRISDDGVGIPTGAEASGGFGLRGMRERAEAADGRIAITGNRRKGTVVEASWTVPTQLGAASAVRRTRWPAGLSVGRDGESRAVGGEGG